MDYCKFTKVVAQIESAVPDLVSLLKQINIISNMWYVTTALVNVLFPILIRKEDQNCHVVSGIDNSIHLESCT